MRRSLRPHSDSWNLEVMTKFSLEKGVEDSIHVMLSLLCSELSLAIWRIRNRLDFVLGAFLQFFSSSLFVCYWTGPKLRPFSLLFFSSSFFLLLLLSSFLLLLSSSFSFFFLPLCFLLLLPCYCWTEQKRSSRFFLSFFLLLLLSCFLLLLSSLPSSSSISLLLQWPKQGVKSLVFLSFLCSFFYFFLGNFLPLPSSLTQLNRNRGKDPCLLALG